MRLSAHLTQEEVAEKIGVTARYIMALENKNKHPSVDNLIRLVHTLNISACSPVSINKRQEIYYIPKHCSQLDIADLPSLS